MTLAIHYSPVKTPSEPGQIYGLQVAILDWMRAFFRHGQQDRFTFLVEKEQAVLELQELATECGVDPSRLAFLDARFPRENLGPLDTVFRPDFDPRHLLWQRNLAGGLGFSFCGLAHGVAGLDSGAVLARYCLGPSRESDAIVCPSYAIRGAVEDFWGHYGDFINARFGAQFECPVQLPVIPLGVDIKKMAARATPDKRAAQRKILGLDESDVVVLWVGRLSHAIKAHPLPMFRAVEEAARRSKRKVHFVMQGYFVPESAEDEFRRLGAEIMQTASLTFVAADDKRFPDGLWASGDIFLSLVENMQESFGLTPIEAIAAGLPRVLSDWDGYRDSVTHGQDGFLVPTIQPPAGMGDALAELMLGGRESYGGYLAKTSQCVAVDYRAAASAIAMLIDNGLMRMQIIQKARARLAAYEWQNVIRNYEDLWADLAARRQVEEPLPLVHPHLPDPFAMYAGFASHVLGPQDRVALISDGGYVQSIMAHEMNVMSLDVMIPAGDIAPLLNWIAQAGQPTITEIETAFAVQDQIRLRRTLTWLIKLGIIGMVRV